jgi:hypothetical protein
MEECRGEGEGGRGKHLEALEEKGRADAKRDHADVLDARVREETLEIVLGQRIEDAEHRRQRAEPDHEGTPPRGATSSTSRPMRRRP